MTREETGLYTPVPWRAHLSSLQWEQGDHILIAAPTKSGKTTMVRHLLSKRSHVVIFVSKLKDPTFLTEYKGWTILEEWPKDGPKPWETRILLWPKAEKTLGATLAKMRRVFAYALDSIAHEGKRCVVIDEGLMFTDPKYLGFGSEVGMLHYFGRSSGISMVTLTQRAAWIPVVVYSSVTHAYIARTRDRNDHKRLADLGGGLDLTRVRDTLTRLPSRHDYLYLNPQGDATPVVVNTRK